MLSTLRFSHHLFSLSVLFCAPTAGTKRKSGKSSKKKKEGKRDYRRVPAFLQPSLHALLRLSPAQGAEKEKNPGKKEKGKEGRIGCPRRPFR